MKTITVEEELPVSIAPLTKAGNPARVDGDPIWTLSEGAPGTLEPGATPFDKVFRPSADGLTGAALITVEVDADLGEGVRMLTGALAVAVVDAEAETLAINAGDATPITPAPAADPVSTDTPAPEEATAEVTTDPVAAEVVADPPAADPVVEAQPDAPAADPVAEEVAADPVAEVQPEVPAGEVVAEGEVAADAPAEAVSETQAEGGETPAG